MAVVLDTAFLVDYARGDPGAHAMLDRLVDEGETLLVSTLVLAEYLAGTTAQRAHVLGDAVEILPFTEGDALAAGALAKDALKEGSFPGWHDTMIAGFARHRGARGIVTRNARHFPREQVLTY